MTKLPSIVIGLTFAGILTPRSNLGQLKGPHAANLDPIRTTQPICDGDTNDGLDIAIPVGTPVLAPSSGTVSAIWNDKTYGCGLTVLIDLPDGSVAGLTWLSDTMVPVGMVVKQGQIVAHSGQTGNTKNPALHYTLYTRDKGKVDPRSLPQAKTSASEKAFTDPADLKGALDRVDASDEPDYIKSEIRKRVIQEFNQSRSLAEADYNDNLKKAVDAWYANGKNWRKIPPVVWGKLRDADRGRIKNGVDPEMTQPARNAP